jgi:hypothetical protein
MVGRWGGGSCCHNARRALPVALWPALRVEVVLPPRMLVVRHRSSADSERPEPLRRRRVTLAELLWLRRSRF